MTVPLNSNQPALAHAQGLHLIDIENLTEGRVTPERTRSVFSDYMRLGIVGSTDKLVCATPRWRGAAWMFDAPITVRRILTDDRPDAADEALIDAAYNLQRHDLLVIASNDHAFVPLVRHAKDLAIPVVHVRGTAQLSYLLYRECSHSIPLAAPTRRAVPTAA